MRYIYVNLILIPPRWRDLWSHWPRFPLLNVHLTAANASDSQESVRNTNNSGTNNGTIICSSHSTESSIVKTFFLSLTCCCHLLFSSMAFRIPFRNFSDPSSIMGHQPGPDSLATSARICGMSSPPPAAVETKGIIDEIWWDHIPW